MNILALIFWIFVVCILGYFIYKMFISHAEKSKQDKITGNTRASDDEIT